MDFAVHCALSEKLSKTTFDDQLPDRREQIDCAAYSCDYQPDCEKTTGRAERLYLAKPNRRDCDYGHVDRIDSRHVLNQPIADGTDHGHQQYAEECQRESASRGHLAAFYMVQRSIDVLLAASFGASRSLSLLPFTTTSQFDRRIS